MVELLIVISIIALLATLLLPALSRSKAQAKSILCRSNLRQLGLQLHMYVGENNLYPEESYVRKTLLTAIGDDRSASDQTEEGITRCPTRVYGRQRSGPEGVISFGGSTSYGYNVMGYIGANGPVTNGSFGLGGREIEGQVYPVTETAVKVPSDMIMLGDNFALLPRSNGDYLVDEVIESPLALSRDESSVFRGAGVNDAKNKAGARHFRRGNVGFCDGHVEKVTFRSLFLDRDDASLRRWNIDNEPHR